MKPHLLALFLLLFSYQSFSSGGRSVCGKDDTQEMHSLSDDFKRMGAPIGILRYGKSSCTGTLVSKDLLLTAGHCHSDCKNIFVTFGFLKGRQESFSCKEVLEFNDSGNMNKDYMIVRLEGTPGVEWGWYDVASRKVKKGESLLMIHHAEGLHMKVSRNNCEADSIKEGMLYHSCDTQPGTSGAGIILPNYLEPEKSRIIAVHSYGGCNESSTQFNSGATIENLLPLSPILRSLAKD